jgi:hypothetical protein
VVQVVECLPSQHEAMGSNPSTDKKKKTYTLNTYISKDEESKINCLCFYLRKIKKEIQNYAKGKKDKN